MRVRLRSWLGVALIWVATVAGVSATAWFAIDRAGRDLTGAGGQLSPASVGTVFANGTQGALSPTGGTASPSSLRTQATGSTTPRDQSVNVAGGQVSVRCNGAAISLRIAQPDNGWRVAVDSSGPHEVHLSFRLGDEDDVLRGTQVNAVCSAGTPEFQVHDKS